METKTAFFTTKDLQELTGEDKLRKELGIKYQITPEEAKKINYRRSQTVFPQFDSSEYDNLTMKILSYVDIKKKALRVLAQLNTRGFLMSLGDTLLHRELILYKHTPCVCKWDTHHWHLDELSHYKTIKIVQIQTYEDANYLKGITFTYLCDGWVTEVMSYLPE
jgi:hypothetical protein